MSKAVADWFFLSGIGIIFGLVWAWFWVQGRITQKSEYWHRVGPRWLEMVAGPPRESFLFSRRVASLLPRITAIAGIIATIALYQVYFVTYQVSIGLLNMWQADSSFPVFLLLTWGILVWLAERALKRTKLKLK